MALLPARQLFFVVPSKMILIHGCYAFLDYSALHLFWNLSIIIVIDTHLSSCMTGRTVG